MISSTRQIQGHFLDVGTDTSTTVQFTQRTGDFDTLGNIVYVALALGLTAITAYALAGTGLHDALTVLIVAFVGAATIALRIAIYNRYGLNTQQIKVSPEGDVEWLGGWLQNSEIAHLQVVNGERGRFDVVCTTQKGMSHTIASCYAQVQAEAICRDLRRGLNRAGQSAPRSVNLRTVSLKGAE